MKQRPIIFNAEMVRAILAGQKTQARGVANHKHTDGSAPDPLMCPYGLPGDRLWVREACRAEVHGDTGLCGVRYLADDAFVQIQNTREASDDWARLYWYRGIEGVTVQSIHMPRWASRITLEITRVRVQRLHAITGPECLREGVSVPACMPEDGADMDWARRAFRRQWESIHGKGSWDANPWVWVIDFDAVRANDSKRLECRQN